MYPPLFFFTSQSVHCHFCFSVSTFSPSLLLRHDHHPCFPPSLSASLRCDLMITVTNGTFVYKLPLWSRHQCCCSCVLLVLWGFFCLGCIAAPQVHSCLSHMMTPLWPSAALSLVIRWRESTIVPSLRSCGRRGSQPVSFIARQLTHPPVLFYCAATLFPFPAVYMQCAVDILFLQWCDL